MHTSSLGVSCLIFFAYYFHKYINSQTKRDLLFAGFFLAWLILLRGFCLFYLPIVVLFLYLSAKSSGKKLKEIIVTVLLFLVPFVLAESVWITRNYISLHKFVPLQTSFVPGGDSKNQEYGYRSITKYSLTKVRELIFTWGGETPGTFLIQIFLGLVGRAGIIIRILSLMNLFSLKVLQKTPFWLCAMK